MKKSAKQIITEMLTLIVEMFTPNREWKSYFVSIYDNNHIDIGDTDHYAYAIRTAIEKYGFRHKMFDPDSLGISQESLEWLEDNFYNQGQNNLDFNKIRAAIFKNYIRLLICFGSGKEISIECGNSADRLLHRVQYFLMTEFAEDTFNDKYTVHWSNGDGRSGHCNYDEFIVANHWYHLNRLSQSMYK